MAPRGSLLHAGHAVAPWSIFVADDTAEVHLTTARQESPQGTVVAASDAGAVKASWTGLGGMLRISGRASDFRERVRQGVALDVRYRVDRVPVRSVEIGLRCTEPLCGTHGGAMLDVTRVFRKAQPGHWRTLSIPLSCFAAIGADLSSVEVPFAIETSGSFGLALADVSLAQKPHAGASGCPAAGASR
jgi:beta-glucosidase